MKGHSLFDQLYAGERARRVAVLYEHREIIYEELRQKTVGTAEALHALGIADKDRVAILLNDSPEFIASFVAIISLGAIAVPINLALRREDQLFILKDCGACAAIIEASSMPALMNAGDAPPELKDMLVVRRDGDSQVSSVRCINVQDFESAKKV